MSILQTENGQRWLLVGGVLRNSGEGWGFIRDNGHEPDDLTLGTVTSTSIQIKFPLVWKVCYLHVTGDEKFAQLGGTFGASVGFDNAIIQGRLASGLFNPQTWVDPKANLWVDGRFWLGAA